MWRASLVVFLLAAIVLGYGSGDARLGDGYLDPVGRITAQDEAVYSHAAIRMAERGEWMTPHFLGRFFLYKPPLVYWLSGASARVFGISAEALRLPAVLASAAAVAIVFHWVAAGEAGAWRGLMAAVLLFACPLWQTLGRRNLTDAPLCLGITAFCWFLVTGRAAGWLAVCVAWSILVKSTAGLIPLMILGLWWWFGRPALTRVLATGVGAALLAAPWFVYQWRVHPRWFTAEFIGVELLAFGAEAPPQTSAESTLGFYSSRLVWAALPLLIATLAAVPGWVRAARRGDPDATLAACWLVMMGAAIAGYEYRNATYLLPMLPAMAIVAGRWAHPASLLALALVPFAAGRYPDTVSTVAQMAERYAALPRSGRDLIVVGADDNFYAATLPLAGRLRYALPGTGQPAKGFALDFAAMGIAVSVGDFVNPGALDAYRPRLREWGLPDDTALGTVIAWPDATALHTLIRSSPGRDFLIPASAPAPPSDSGHVVQHDAAGNRLLLAR